MPTDLPTHEANRPADVSTKPAALEPTFSSALILSYQSTVNTAVKGCGCGTADVATDATDGPADMSTERRPVESTVSSTRGHTI